MRTETINIIGSGGHAMVVLDSLAALGVPAQSIAVLDQNADRIGLPLGSHTIQAFVPAKLAGGSAHICIGDNKARERIALALHGAGCKLKTIIDPRTVVSPSASIGPGSFVAPRAIVAARATTGQCCIVNHGAIVDHECILSDFVHIAPGATLAGAVRIGHGTLVGMGANILPRVSVSANATIGAGAVVVRDATKQAVYLGIPAKGLDL